MSYKADVSSVSPSSEQMRGYFDLNLIFKLSFCAYGPRRSHLMSRNTLLKQRRSYLCKISLHLLTYLIS